MPITEEQAQEIIYQKLIPTVLMELYNLGDRSGKCWPTSAKNPLTAIMKAMSTIEQVLHLLTETRPI